MAQGHGLLFLCAALSHRLVAVQALLENRCPSPQEGAKVLSLTSGEPKIVENVVPTTQELDESHVSRYWAFDPPGADVRISVTPEEHTMDPDISLYASVQRTPPSAAALDCKFVARAQDYGGDMLMISDSMVTKAINATRYFLKVFCRKKGCAFHVAFVMGNGTDVREEIDVGQTRSGIAYRGVPLHYYFDCKGECQSAAEEGTNRRLTISVWPRDATSVHHLRLLVKPGSEPTTGDHLKSSRGWFSGEVVGTAVQAGRFYITVLKRHGRQPMPFVLSVTLPETVQKITLGKPYFGAVSRSQVAFYSFQVEDPKTDIAVYLTKLDGDPDMSISHSAVNSHPTPYTGQWQSKNVGDDELIITPTDPKRKAHPTGWFNVGVHGFKHTAFSIIVLAEPHVEAQEASGQVIDWTELWLGLPQTLSAWPGHPGNFLFYSQLVTPRLFVQVTNLEGGQPDACMANCGLDPHQCPYISKFASPLAVSKSPEGAVSQCHAAAIRGFESTSQATVDRPCSSCWYSLLVTSEASTNRSRFRVLLGADGRAHPLVAGEAFRGHADAGDASVLLVFDVAEGELQNRTKANSTLRFIMTPVYGDPMFAVHSGTEDGPILFASNVTGKDYFSLSFGAVNGKTRDGTYYIVVWANSKHAQFRMQVDWDFNATLAGATPAGTPPSGTATKDVAEETFRGAGLPVLRAGKAQEGVVQGSMPSIFLYEPVGEGTPGIRISLRAERAHRLRIYAVPVRTGKNHTQENIVGALTETHKKVVEDALSVGWLSKNGSHVLSIPSSDQRYVAPGSGNFYAISVFRLTTDNTSTASFLLEVGLEGGVQELLATGVPMPGVVRAGEYSTYRIVVAEEGKHLAVTLKAITGDSDLYLGVNASVARGNSFLNSTLYGSDAVFVPAFGQLNTWHCSRQVIQTKGECAYFVTVLGSSKFSEYEISATVPDGTPVLLGPNNDHMLLVPPRGHQYLVLPLTGKNMTLQVQVQKGKLASVNLKIYPEAHAKHPNHELTALSRATADMHGKKFAGVWSLHINPAEAKVLCEKAMLAMRSTEAACMAFISLRAATTVVGKATLQVEGANAAAPGGDKDKAPADGTPGGGLLVLEAGVPSRGTLNTKDDILCYGFTVQDTRGDLSVLLTPLSKCSPILQLEFPSNNGNRVIENLPQDPRLNFVSARMGQKDSRFKAGLYYLWVRQLVSERCDFDIRAQIEVAGSTADFAGVGMAAPTTLLLNTPVYASGETDKYWLFTSQIEQADDAPKRDFLELRLTVLAGDVQVAIAVLNTSSSKNSSKEERLSEAFSELLPVPETSGGVARIFSSHLRQSCGAALACQVVMRVRPSRGGRAADYLVVAVDGSQGRSEVLLGGVPVRGCLGKACPPGHGNVAQYQLFINNPTASMRLRLSCQGPDKDEACKSVVLSADARPTMPETLPERKYAPTFRGVGSLALTVNVLGSSGPGACRVPCVLLIRAELDSHAASGVTTNFTLSSVLTSGYELLLDGGEPITARVSSSTPAYFLFDSRRPSPLLTLAAKVAWDPMDQDISLVSMYVLDCDTFSPPNSTEGESSVSPAAMEDPKTRPSAENYRFRALPSSRGQLLAYVWRGPGSAKLDEGRHCYYRVAVVSHRAETTEFSIRGFDWHAGTPLLLGEPVEGVVDRRHPFSFQLEGSPTSRGTRPQVTLSLEVCSGDVRLLASSSREKASSLPANDGGLLPTSLPLEDARWLEVSAPTGKLSGYILSAEDPEKRVWLEARPHTQITVRQDGGSYRLSWPRARLFGAGQPANGVGGEKIQYEVFYVRADMTVANVSTPCGLYFDHRFKRAWRKPARAKNRTTLFGLKPGYKYIFNVVARNWASGQSMAYTPYNQYVFPELSSKSGAPAALPGGSFLEEVGPLFVIGLSLALIAYARPCCKGSSRLPSWRHFEMELPSWTRGRRHEAYTSSSGSYAPPSVVGQAHYSQMR